VKGGNDPNNLSRITLGKVVLRLIEGRVVVMSKENGGMLRKEKGNFLLDPLSDKRGCGSIGSVIGLVDAR
jgi:hypothetical protein